MSYQQQIDFIKAVLPFERLDQAWLLEVAQALDVVYFPVGESIPLDSEKNAFVYFVIKGRVAECDSANESRQCAIYGHHAQFGVTPLLDKQVGFEYQALEETILYRLAFSVFQRVIKHNAEFEAFYLQDITHKLSAFHRQLQEQASSEAMMGSVRIAPLHPLVEVSMNTSIQTCVEQMETAKSDACLVKNGDEHGIVTSSDLLRGLALHGFDLNSSVADLASFPVISIQQQDYLFNALLKMTRYGVDRLMVRDKQRYIGVLHQKELMSLFANQSGLVMLTLERAACFDDLKQAIVQIDRLVQGLANKGVKTHYIAKLVNELHRKVQAKLWDILDSADEYGATTLMVMGSEGRSEQVVRTDQDNALIVDEKVQIAGLLKFSQRYSEQLIALGFPPCPGQIMLSNPAWCLTQKAFEKQVRLWFDQPSADSYMNLAILFDAQVVRGDDHRLQELKQRFLRETRDNLAFLPQFARSVLQFDTPIGLFGRLITQHDAGHSIDLKKGGIFPIVHGVRCLAIEKGILKTNTHWRIRELINARVFDEDFGVELGETLNFLNTLRLQAMLAKQQRGLAADNQIETDKLTHFQQDLLKDAFAVVNQFKRFVQHHFKLDRLL